MGSPSPSTLKALGAVCGNVCAFPGCPAPIYDTRYNILVGEVCHIEANSEKGPRYREEQPDEERQGFANLVFMCQPHHTVIDDKSRLDEFTVPILRQMKRDHEEKSHNTLLTEDLLVRLVLKVLELQTPVKPPAKVVPVIESYRTSTDHHGIDYYCFRVSLRNDGPKTVRDFRLEVEIPNAYANPTHLNSMSLCRVRGDVTVYTHTDKHFGDFALFPKNMSDLVMNTDYQMRLEQYKDASGSITVSVYCDDELAGSVEYSIRGNRNRDRMIQLGLAVPEE